MSSLENSKSLGFLSWTDLPIRTIFSPGPPSLPRTLNFDVGAKEIVAIPIEGHETITIQATLGNGWTHDKNTVPRYGPAGLNLDVPEGRSLLAVPTSHVGSVVAAFYHEARTGADLHEWRRIFKSGLPMHIGDTTKHFRNPYTGFLMFAMNDAFYYPLSLPNDGYFDNDGSVRVNVAIIRSP